VFLLIFDQDNKKNWDEKIFSDTVKHQGKQITIFGM